MELIFMVDFLWVRISGSTVSVHRVPSLTHRSPHLGVSIHLPVSESGFPFSAFRFRLFHLTPESPPAPRPLRPPLRCACRPSRRRRRRKNPGPSGRGDGPPDRL